MANSPCTLHSRKEAAVIGTQCRLAGLLHAFIVVVLHGDSVRGALRKGDDATLYVTCQGNHNGQKQQNSATDTLRMQLGTTATGQVVGLEQSRFRACVKPESMGMR
jgi:hypothetical protein